MNVDLNNIQNNSIVFTTEINDVFFISPKSGVASLNVAVYNLVDTSIRNVYVCDFDVIENKKCWISGLGDVFRDFLLNNQYKKYPVASFWIKIYVSSDEILNKPLTVISHFGNFNLKASEYLERNFLNDCKISIFPHNAKNKIIPHAYAFVNNVYKVEEITREFIQRRVNSKTYHDEKWRDSLLHFFILDPQIFGESGFCDFNIKASDDIEIDLNHLEYIIVENFVGKGFVFRNSFGLKEYVFIPGVMSYSSKKNASEVAAQGKLMEVDVADDSTFSLKIEKAPLWLVENARALFKSNCVLMINDLDELNADDELIWDKSNVIVTDLSGNISENPEELSDINLTFKYADK